MADGRHFETVEKRRYLRIVLIDLHKILHGDTYWPSKGYGQLKFPTFKTS